MQIPQIKEDSLPADEQQPKRKFPVGEDYSSSENGDGSPG